MGCMKETSLWLDSETYRGLAKIADKNNRTLIGQIRFWIKEANK